MSRSKTARRKSAKKSVRKRAAVTKPKKVLACGDFHCGHLAGLTPPEWRGMWGSGIKGKTEKMRQECWDYFSATLKEQGPFDVAIINGDMIDGNGFRSGSVELLTADMNEQTKMAMSVISRIPAERFVFTRGTPYHTGTGEDFEDWISEEYEAKIGDHEWVDVNGLIFDVKHHVGSSSVPHGRGTAVAKERVWNLMWDDVGEQPRSDVFLRSHVHSHTFIGGRNWLAMTLPALQAAKTKYGRRCSGTVDFGLVTFQVTSKENYSWQSHIAKLKTQKPELVRI